MDFMIEDKEIETYIKLFFKVTLRNKWSNNYSVVASLQDGP